MSNTIRDFKLTAITRGNIVCPKCAARIGIHEPNSFQLTLTDLARDYIETKLELLRGFTKVLETYLTSKIYSISMGDFGQPYEQEKIGYLRELAEILKIPVAEDGDFTQLKIDQYGLFEDSQDIKSHADKFKDQIDPYRHIENFKTEIPDLNDIKNSNDQKEKKDACKQYLKYLTGEALERTSNGLIYNLIAEQTKIENSLDNLYEDIKKIISVIFPTLSQYYNFIENNLEEIDEKDKQKCQDNLKRARLLLVMLHGYKFYPTLENIDSDKKIDKKISENSVRKLSQFLNTQYKLPEKTTISIDLLTQFVSSRVLIDNKSDTLKFLAEPDLEKFNPLNYQSFLQELFNFDNWMDNIINAGARLTGVEKKYTIWLKHLDRLVNVACKNEIEVQEEEEEEKQEQEIPPHNTISEETQSKNAVNDNSEDEQEPVDQKPTPIVSETNIRAKKEKNKGDKSSSKIDNKTKKIYQPCGWSPSKRKSHSIIILGSPGTGKTCLLQSGLAQLRSGAAGAGITITPEDNLSRKLLYNLEEVYRLGNIKGSTKVNFALNLEITQLEDTQYINRFTFIDIPGDKVSSLVSQVKEQRVESDLKKLLRNANTIMFLLDFWSDDKFLYTLEKNNKDAFEEQITLKENVKASDKTRQERIPQFDLLWELVNVLAEEGQQEIDKKFIFIIPKIDTLAFSSKSTPNETHKKYYFFRKFYEKLRDKKYIVHATPNLNPDPENFQDMYSVIQGSNSEKTLLEICQEISDWGRESILNVGEVLKEGTDQATRDELKNHIERHFLEFIEDRFKEQDQYGINKTWYLPVSALGKIPSYRNKKFNLDQKEPNPILAEYVFLLPILLAFEEQKRERQAQQGQGGDEDQALGNL